MSACSSSDLEQWLQERELLSKLIQQQLLRAQQRMKHQADKNHSEREFSVGELVYLKLQPYVQSSAAPRNNQKLAYRFFGPFQILARVGSVAYKLDLPSHSKIHPVIHVSQLKKHIPPQSEVSKDLTNAIINDTEVAIISEASWCSSPEDPRPVVGHVFSTCDMGRRS